MGNTDSALGHPLRPQLEEACRRSSAAYAHMPERVTVLRDDELTYPEACRGLQVEAGAGPVGRAFLGKSAELVSVDALPPAQARVAKEFNIRSMACAAWNAGVLEVGTDKLWKDMPSLPVAGAASTEAKLAGLGGMWDSGSTDCSDGSGSSNCPDGLARTFAQERVAVIEVEESGKRVACF